MEMGILSYQSLADIARKMRHIDIAMLMTHGPQGHIAGRPMSNNREVDYHGNSYYFAWDDSQIVRDIEKDPKVALAFQGGRHMLGTPGVHINVEGTATLIRDRKLFLEHWNKDLERWFEQGVDTPGLVMIKVHARRVHYWDGSEEGEIDVA